MTEHTSRAPTDGRPLLLALRALGLGDLLTAVPALRGLALAFSGHRRVLAAPAHLAPLALLSGAVHEVVDARPLERLDARLARPAVAMNLHGSGPESHRVLLELSPARLLAYANPEVPETAGFPLWREEEHEVARWCRLLEGFGVPCDPGDLDLPAPSRPTPEAARGAVVLHAGAGTIARRWPEERWSEVARRLLAGGRRVVLTGGSAERMLAERIAAGAGLPPEAVLAGSTDVLDLAAVLAAADRLVVGDTGVAHLATALGVPSVVIFGPVPPSRWGPPADRPWHRAIWAGSTGDPWAADPDPGLLDVSASDVLEALEDLPSPEPVRS